MNIPYADIIVTRSQYHDNISGYGFIKRMYLKAQYWIWKQTMSKYFKALRFKEYPPIYKEDIFEFLNFMQATGIAKNTMKLKLDDKKKLHTYGYDLNSTYQDTFYVTKYKSNRKSERYQTTHVKTIDSNEGIVLFDYIIDTVQQYIRGEN